jgi:hypothetical protein
LLGPLTVTCGTRFRKRTVTVSRRHPCDHSESRSSSGPLAAHGPLAGPAAGGAEMCMRRRVGPLRVTQLLRPACSQRSQNGLAAGGAEMCMLRRVAPAARARPMVPVEPTAGGAASYSAVQLGRGPRAAHGPSWARCRWCPAEHAARCRSCGVADGVVHQVGPSGTAHGSSELVKAHTPRRGRPSCRNRPGPTGGGPEQEDRGRIRADDVYPECWRSIH